MNYGSFKSWLRDREVQEYSTVGQAEDWSLPASDGRFNGEEEKKKGVRSKYIATMRKHMKKMKK